MASIQKGKTVMRWRCWLPLPFTSRELALEKAINLCRLWCGINVESNGEKQSI